MVYKITRKIKINLPKDLTLWFIMPTFIEHQLDINKIDMNHYSQDTYRINKEIENGVIHIPYNHRDLEYEYVGLEEVESFPSQSSEFRGLEIEDMGIELSSAMGWVLTPRERCVIELSFGLPNGEEMNYDEIGRELLLTRERVRQIKVRAMEKLKDYFITNL